MIKYTGFTKMWLGSGWLLSPFIATSAWSTRRWSYRQPWFSLVICKNFYCPQFLTTQPKYTSCVRLLLIHVLLNLNVEPLTKTWKLVNRWPKFKKNKTWICNLAIGLLTTCPAVRRSNKHFVYILNFYICKYDLITNCICNCSGLLCS